LGFSVGSVQGLYNEGRRPVERDWGSCQPLIEIWKSSCEEKTNKGVGVKWLPAWELVKNYELSGVS
jgi:hypothetical protein